MDEVNIENRSQWKLNGETVKSINRFVTESDECDHYIYLGVPESLCFPAAIYPVLAAGGKYDEANNPYITQ